MPNDREIKLIKQIDAADAEMETIKDQWRPVHNDVIDNMLTSRERIGEDSSQEGRRRDELIYDGTTTSSLNIWVNGMQGNMVSADLVWFLLRLSNVDLNDIDEVKEWLQHAQSVVYTALQRSNFYSEITSYLRDGGGLGTANIYGEEDISTGRIFFVTVPIKEYKIAENRFKKVDIVHRDFKLTARKLEQMFSKDKLTMDMQKALQNNRGSLFDVKHAVFPRGEYDDRMLNAINKPFASVWLADGGRTTKGSQILRESGFDEFPYAVWRMRKEADETYGRSPAIDYLGEIKGMNQMEKDILKGSQLMMEPPIDVHKDYAGDFKRVPAAINWFDKPEQKSSATDLGIDLSAGFKAQERKRQFMREAYFVDLFLLIASKEGTMTATEVLKLEGEKVSILAPVISSLSTQALSQIIDLVFNIEFRAGRIQTPPEILQGENYDIDYVGPLALAQKAAFETKGIERAVASVIPLLEVAPEVRDNFKWDNIARDGSASNGLAQKYIVSESDRDQGRKERAEAAALERQALEAQQGMDTLETATKADKNVDGKISEALTGA